MLRKISLFFFPIIFFVLIYQYQKNKHYSWDLTAYVAEVLKIDSPKDLHLDTYKTLSVSLPKERYNHLTNFEYGKTNLENKKIYIITPEQFSFTAERELIETVGVGAALNAEVLTFNRMAYRVMNEVGGATKTALSNCGKAMLIYNILLKGGITMIFSIFSNVSKKRLIPQKTF